MLNKARAPHLNSKAEPSQNTGLLEIVTAADTQSVVIYVNQAK